MGVDYRFYAEVKAGGKWFNISPMIRNVDGKVRTVPLMTGRSLLYDFVNDLEEFASQRGVPEDASEDIKGVFYQPLDEEMSGFGHRTFRQYYQSLVFVVKYVPAIRSRVVKDRPCKFRGYVSKRQIASFEVNETEEITSWLTPQEYNALSPNKKKYYAWFEWNEPDSEYGYLYDLYQKIENQIVWFVQHGIPYESEIDSETISFSDVRVIVQQT